MYTGCSFRGSGCTRGSGCNALAVWHNEQSAPVWSVLLPACFLGLHPVGQTNLEGMGDIVHFFRSSHGGKVLSTPGPFHIGM